MKRLVIFGLLLLTALPAAATDALRCGARIVSTGALAVEVLAACGEPTYRDRWLYGYPYGAAAVADVEEWYYNFGPNQLLRILRLRNGRVFAIDTDGYGYTAPPAERCDPTQLVEGLSKFRLLLLCGEPVTREALSVLTPWHRHRNGQILHGYWEAVYRERWVYNFGSRFLLRVVTLENGRIAQITSADRGFDPR